MIPSMMSGIIPGLPPVAGLPTPQTPAASGEQDQEQDQTEDNTLMEPGPSLNMLHGEGS